MTYYKCTIFVLFSSYESTKVIFWYFVTVFMASSINEIFGLIVAVVGLYVVVQDSYKK